ncbi:hydrogenase formation protein HypD [Desulfolutivibrio sulfoxidireducens]|uniref:hydrogenase formation protein HypD n=1 Tax=Desulfolutivibrio sulfoxidireducens TaxID=2773299 RepID=UPI00159E0098|nr:hydrogenase formation protein HypD [Desulfolutivibrio sulfoxidireducens]QLA16832.1 hydrogenase formation protein HypD [Desulfolutivibrio sulfoxidireducens]QLA20396.1 hydrogenase formation protein HypD [Desulfolutivibrio sulfoxidireducens]
MNSFEAFKDPALCRRLLARLTDEATTPMRFMEVCGTHTVAIFQSGLRSLLPKTVIHLTGPGCPVCVTHESEVAAYLELAGRDEVIIATFGDLMRVPGPKGRNLKTASAEGAAVEVVYSPFDALALAKAHPDRTVVFLGIGFETTAPTVAATIRLAREQGLTNFLVMSFHKLVPPALRALLADPEAKIDAFLLPGHVSAVIGAAPYAFLADDYRVPSVITGFEPLDILQALLYITEMRRENTPRVINEYSRVVAQGGNPKALAVMAEVFAPVDALWRGLGVLPQSGLAISEAYAEFDAFKVLGITLKDHPPLPGCRCGEVLKGKLSPNQCPLFAKACTPATPVGPCMVSTEGGCAAYYKYRVDA